MVAILGNSRSFLTGLASPRLRSFSRSADLARPARLAVSASASAKKPVKEEGMKSEKKAAKPVPMEPKEYDALDLGADLRDEYNTYWPAKGAERRAGIIMHPTSLPGAYGTGEIGKEANAFVDWMVSAGLRVWQVLPLVPPEDKYWSPYSSTDANAGNIIMIAVEELVDIGLLAPEDLPPQQPVADADFPAVMAWKGPLLKKAALELLNGAAFKDLRADLAAFRSSNPWVEDSAIFEALTRSEELDGLIWWDWPAGLRDRDPAALSEARSKLEEEVEVFVAQQFLFDLQWKNLKAYANSKGVSLLGDMPIYVSGHCVDVWANQEKFILGEDKKPGLVSGVPPDAFSETGQLWGTPLYDWAVHQKEGYAWWAGRLSRAFDLYDECRIDHFRAFAGYWAIPGDSETAMTGSWKKGPGIELFQALAEKMGNVPIVAEDLGVITRDVVELREDAGFPGMVVLQFAWEGGPGNTHLPHNHYENSFCYPGTHDNETAVGWWRDSASDKAKAYLSSYCGGICPGPDGSGVNWMLIDSAMWSVSRCTVVLMQDIMGLDNSTGRMNTPGKAEGNWAWRVGDSGIWKKLEPEAQRLMAIVEASGRKAKEEEKQEEDGDE